MEVILNIGLARNQQADLTVAQALEALTTAGFTCHEHTVHTSDSETTVVTRAARGRNVRANVYHLSILLEQDCIAIYNPRTQLGELAGPRAADWGDFNPEFFLLLDGSRLNTNVTKAA